MLWTPRWLVRHAVAAALVLTFLALGWWQLRRAIAGNPLSIGYAAEWPLFAAFVVFVWAREVRQEVHRQRTETQQHTAAGAQLGPEVVAGGRAAAASGAPPPVRSSRPERAGPGYDDSDDQDLAAYNRYLAWLAAHPNASPAEYPG